MHSDFLDILYYCYYSNIFQYILDNSQTSGARFYVYLKAHS